MQNKQHFNAAIDFFELFDACTFTKEVYANGVFFGYVDNVVNATFTWDDAAQMHNSNASGVGCFS